MPFQQDGSSSFSGRSWDSPRASRRLPAVEAEVWASPDDLCSHIHLGLKRAPPLVPRTDSLNSHLAGSDPRVPVVSSSRYRSLCASGWREAWPPAGRLGTRVRNQAAGCVSASGQGAHLPRDLDTHSPFQCVSPRPLFFFSF